MKIYLIKSFLDKSWNEILTLNKCYEGELTPIIYDPNTFQKTSPSYIVKCNDGKFRKVDTEYFITQEEWREQQLNKII